MSKHPLTIIEWDIKICSLTYGVGACTAVLGTTGQHKCHNTLKTCQDPLNFSEIPLTLRFIAGGSETPKDGTYFPCVTDISSYSSSVNLAGSNSKLGNLGKRGELSVTLEDFAYHDRYVDKYQSERLSGAAQADGIGYDPSDRGTFLRKLKARFPNYANSNLRRVDGYIEDGVFTAEQTLHFVVTAFDGPKDNKFTLEGEDILKLTDEDEALAPKAATATLLSDIDETATSLTLSPEGVGDKDYPTEGWAIINDEIVQYTRVGDEVTLVLRAGKKTEVSTHDAGDDFQSILVFEDAFPDEVIVTLLTDYTDTPAECIKTIKWRQERKRWCPTLKLDAVIVEPTGVDELIGELAPLGISVWWDAANYEVGFDVNSPVDPFKEVANVSDDILKSAEAKDNDEDRITNVVFYFDIDDYTGSATSASNYNKVLPLFDASTSIYEDTRIREVFCRWVTLNNISSIRIAGKRLLQRFSSAPTEYTLEIDTDLRDIGLVDVIRLNSDIILDEFGVTEPTLIQVVERSEDETGNSITLTCQRFRYEGNYGYVMENSANVFGSATDYEKTHGAYLIAEGQDTFSDGTESYKVI